jgi:hypothetical protein
MLEGNTFVRQIQFYKAIHKKEENSGERISEQKRNFTKILMLAVLGTRSGHIFNWTDSQ